MVVGFVSAANIITSIFKLQRLGGSSHSNLQILSVSLSSNDTLLFPVRVWLAIYIVIGLIIPTLNLLWLGSMMTSFLPIMGRSGAHIIPDLYISLIFALITSVIGSFWAPIIAVVRRPKLLMLCFSLATVITVLGATLTPYGFPYSVDLSSPKPQRFWLIVGVYKSRAESELLNLGTTYFQHAERTLHDIDGNVTYNDGGYWIQNLDRNGPRTVKDYISEYSNATFVADACLDAPYCGLPLWKSRDMGLLYVFV